ncbi:carbohydrate ABC transporter permease [Conexibacter sp. JD483]|uniref:carbohydrate ABC transporter permease n=1 Tax=unclassified Conexibacter TaxID=2627773 RepID=UPI00271F657F|nr:MULTISPECIES: carbohydrate ABC transporter permease [unclassified Conexibacter]MDO8188405.1 carbohydrate ABC transporter permease [Conexibacter sp. CPCC 205706]MDO8198192.1 carbohydrate ABC transporter permease [Conexibacter sp. CPCC 205762]MDR9370672.1 carbohydrate ABC transporter permease [Conexibacter sp. JD483]
MTRRVSITRRAALLSFMLIACVITAFPILWMVATAFKSSDEALQTPPVWVPGHPTTDAFSAVNDVIDIPRSFINSLLIAGLTTTGILLTSLLAGYVFAKYRFRGKNALFAVLIGTMFLPPIVTLIPLFRIVTQLGWDASLVGVIVPNLANAFGIFLMRQFIAGVPDELIEAARLDGASELRIVFRIVAPNVLPALAALAMFAFVYHWNSYLWPLTVLQGNEQASPIVISLARLLTYTGSAANTPQVMAGATLAVLPPLILFVILQRFFVNTMSRAGMTG